MNEELMIDQLFQALVTGDRDGARTAVQEATESYDTAEELTIRLYWPIVQMINKLYRSDQLSRLGHHFATRLIRSLLDQAQARYNQAQRLERKILMFCGSGEADELAAQIVADLLEAHGFEVLFGGGGIAQDEILGEVGNQRPDVLLMFASSPSDAPMIRQLIDTIRGVGACPQMQIAVGGGIFHRAEGLAEEIGADLWAHDPVEVIQRLATDSARRATAEQRTVGRNRKVVQSRAA